MTSTSTTVLLTALAQGIRDEVLKDLRVAIRTTHRWAPAVTFLGVGAVTIAATEALVAALRERSQ